MIKVSRRATDGVARDAMQQVRALLPTLALLAALIVLAGIILIMLHYNSDENVTMLVKDPREFTGLPFRAGVYSNLGLLLLWSAAVISFVFGVLLSRSAQWREMAGMLITFAILHGCLAIDDLLLIHEEIGLLISMAIGTDEIVERRSQLEGVVLVVYGVIWLVWAWRYRSVILSTAWTLLALGMAGFVGSATVDVGSYLFPEYIPWTPWMPTLLDLADEMLKLSAYLMLAAWTWRTASAVWERFGNSAGCGDNFGMRAR